MNRVLFIIVAISMTTGLLIGWRLPRLLEKQALSELISQRCRDSSLRSFVLARSKSCSLVEDSIDGTIRFMLLPFMIERRKQIRQLDFGQLAELAGVESKYEQCRWAVNHCLYRGQYKLASEYANAALTLRPLRSTRKSSGKSDEIYRFRELDSMNNEEFFAENLCSLGMYKDAKSVILSLPEIPPMTNTFCNGPHIGYRRGVLAESCMGLGEYDKAIQELSKPIPNVVEGNGTWAMLNFLKAFAHLAKHEKKPAFESILKWSNRLPQTSELESLLIKITNVGDDNSSCKLSKEIINFFDLHKDDITTPQCLDFCGAAMTAYGHKQAAELLLNRAKQIRDQ